MCRNCQKGISYYEYLSYNKKMQPDKLIRSNRKTIALQIDETAQLVVRAPHHVSMRKISSFIQEKNDWIIKTQQKVIVKNKIAEQNIEFRDGKIALFLGKEYVIRLNGKINHIEFDGNYLEFPFKEIELGNELLIKWYKKKSKEVIVPRVKHYAEDLELDYNKISITSAKKRWGSCNSKGNINFSYRLVMAPKQVIDYVIVHELMHLKEMNHSKKFWNLVESVIPDYKQRKKWLKDNQHKIVL